MPRTLDVYLLDRLAGRLTREDTGQLRFVYDDAWLRAADAQPVSRSLPLGSDPFEHRQCRPFFSGLLPEAEVRQAVARALGVTPRNDFVLLELLGGECAGAVTLVPAGEAPPRPSVPDDHRTLSREELSRILRVLPDRPCSRGRRACDCPLRARRTSCPWPW